MEALIGLGAMLVLMALGAPIFVALGTVALVMLGIEGKPLMDAAAHSVSGINSTTFLAVPFFVMAATFMQKGGIARIIIEAAETWVGHIRGGLGLVCVIATTLFAAISGSSVVTAMAMGTVLIPAMMARGYDRPFALGLVGASGTLGILIPPSLSMILYGLIAEVSVPQLFLAGVIPGLIQAAILATWVIFYSRRKGYASGSRATRSEFVSKNLRALPAVAIPLSVFAGIYSGYTTVTESAGVAAVASVLVALLVYREVKPSEVFRMATEAMKAASAVTFIVMFAMLFAHWITGSGVPTALVNLAIEWDLKPWQFLLALNVIMIVLGMFLDAVAVMLIVTPIVLPLLAQLGINPMHFGIVLIVNMEIAFLTPPIGLNIFVLSSIARAPMSEAIRGMLPFVALMALFLLLVTYIPEISLWLPRTMM
ncbi:C4-dicarboxylate transporter, DctM subunit [Pseudooceanicola antarcticus]|uniref:TRAP transporter large permease protein n=1 Tax=Pseudooceanicola antarcticus TaxID=1247613 RepID=A0A285IML1_9RHOB|nr:TRAP transporter large permease [Pseudooceanicola antarcticus]PJE28802.1 TRAP transporter large permease [Pseudooceanicola antarcticus]SNY48201.1 C4-dicarboxylate transporter, DctM subunit [Pseudooceanicola antarcticus]